MEHSKVSIMENKDLMSLLSADKPQTDPANDLLGYAPFAKKISEAIYKYSESESLTLGLYGSWGSGKSTLLKFIQYYLEKMPESEAPIIVEFNPWWFSGQDNLAKTFLGQLSATLHGRNTIFDDLGGLLAKYATGLGAILDATVLQNGLGKKAGKIIKIITDTQQEDIPAIKNKISDILLKSEKHIIIIIDDIDRLEPEETRQLFTVIKALADFPNVIYLLACDQTVVARSIEQRTNMNGFNYLEKIVQIPFTIPRVDEATLRKGLFERINKIVKDTPDNLYEEERLFSLFNDGIEKFFTVQRNIVRFCNTLSITYPLVSGEVNCVDFIAIEAIRVFLPNLYSFIRENIKYFIKHPFSSQPPETIIQDALKSGVPEELHRNINNVLHLIFPYTDKESSPDPDERRLLRLSNHDIYQNYFSFSISGPMSNLMMLDWINNSRTPELFGNVLIQAREKDISEVHILLDRLRDYTDDIPEDVIPHIVDALLDIGDQLIEPEDDTTHFIYIPNIFLINNIFIRLLNRLSHQQKLSILQNALNNGRSIFCQGWILRKLEDDIEKGHETPISREDNAKLTTLWVKHVEGIAEKNELLTHQRLGNILFLWDKWTQDKEKVRKWCLSTTQNDTNMYIFINNFIEYSRYPHNGTVEVKKSINPKDMEPYVNIEDFETRIRRNLENGNTPEEYKELALLYILGMTSLHAGENS